MPLVDVSLSYPIAAHLCLLGLCPHRESLPMLCSLLFILSYTPKSVDGDTHLGTAKFATPEVTGLGGHLILPEELCMRCW